MTKLQVAQETLDKLNGLKQVKSTNDLLQGLKQQERLDKALIVMLDLSSSMSDRMDMTTKIDIAWRVFHNQLMPNMAGWAYGILGFSDIERWLASPSRSTQLSNQVPYANGSTSMGRALEFAWRWIKDNVSQCRIVLLSDGMPTDMSTETILNLARDNASIPIDTVGIGSGDWGYDPEFLRMLSEITGGVFSQAGSVAQLVDTVMRLSPEARPLLGTVKE